MSTFIDVDDVEEDDEVQITVTYVDDAVHVVTGRVRHLISVWGGDSELMVGAMCIDKLPTTQSVKDYTIELLRRDEKHGYYLAALKESMTTEVYLWKYDGEWKIVQCTFASGFRTENSDVAEPSEIRRFIGTDLP